ncbi:MAG: DUF5652 family protein [Candidatus Shapirobacteria bacterium]|nr:DUF5652 family protein [Candidatus Shapirobacteria bacterium]
MSVDQLNQFLNSPQSFLFFAWVLFWKGWALWRASRNEQKVWFGFILIINTIGLLEIVYLLFFQKEGRLWPILTRRGRNKVFVKKNKVVKSKK